MAAKRRTVVVVTGSRAEFGLLDPVMRAIVGHRALRLRSVVAGAHLAQGTWRDVTAAGFAIDAKVPMQRSKTVGRDADVAAVGRGVSGFGRAFADLKPHVVVVLGDRIEAFAAASAASVGGLHLAHVHGGDRAQGVADDAMRHAISKLAHLHFAATPQSRKRLVRMGEQPRFVFNVGSPALDGLSNVKPATDTPQVIVIQHPIGAADADECRWMRQTLQATRGYDRLIFAPNGDPGSTGVRAALKQAAVAVVEHLPRHRFLPLLAGARAVVGNGSAGLIEAAALGTACVNVGPRQAGRQRPAHVIDCDYGQRAVRAALTRALGLDLGRVRHPYGDGRAGRRIADLLAEIDLSAVRLRKQNRY